MLRVHDSSLSVMQGAAEEQLEQHRAELTAYCYRMLGSPFEAEDAVQESLLRAWRSLDRFEGRAALRSWLYRIATNVCFDMLNARERRARPMDLGPAREPVESNLNALPEVTWIEPIPENALAPDGDPADVAVAHETIRPSETSSTWSAQGSKPLPDSLGLYCPKAGEPLAATVGITREPLQPMPGPSHHSKMFWRPLSQRSYGGMDWVASSWISDVKASMS